MKKSGPVFLSADQQKAIVSAALKNGFSVTPTHEKSPNHKEIELKKGLGSGWFSLYISRSVGLRKGELQLVISPTNHKKASSLLLELENVKPAVNNQTKAQVLRSSNYYCFQNKGTAGNRQHWGFGYRLPANDGLLTLNKFLSVCCVR